MWLLYQLLLAVLLAVAAPLVLALRGRHYLPTLPGRLGLARAASGRPEPGREPLWIHAVSVGETAVAATLAQGLPGGLPLLVTTVTPTGQERASAQLGDRATVTYLPFDLAPTLGPFLARFEPRALVLIEGEQWPYLLHRFCRRARPVAVVNGRISDRGFGRLRRLEGWLGSLPRRALFDPVTCFGMQSEQDRDRLVALGVPEEKIVVTGNLKYESPRPRPLPELSAELRRRSGERPILLAGSTMRGEEEVVLEAFRRVGPERAMLVIAPRHPERFDAVEQVMRAAGLRTARRSALAEADARPDAVLLDSLGELASLYEIGLGAFVGGTLVPTGGHNPLEPARVGSAIVVGPSMENFRDMAPQFDQADAWTRVSDAASLAAVWTSWIERPAIARELGGRARELVERHRGALARTLELLRVCIGVDGSTSPE